MLSGFPLLDAIEFEQACDALQRCFQLRGSAQHEWLSVEKRHRNGSVYLNITTHLPFCADRPAVRDRDAIEEEEIVDDEDEEALHDAVAPQPTVDYDIVLSDVYRVPVLYISIRDPQHRYPPTMTTLYENLVPPQLKAQTENVGVIGGITITEHPLTNRPVFFIHPCQTADVMEASVESVITADEYLTIWIGAMGKTVGLNMPLQLAMPNDT